MISDVRLQKTSITHAAVAPSNLHAAITMRSADTELQNTLQLRAKALQIAAPKPDLDGLEALFNKSFKRNIISAKMVKIRWHITPPANMMQPFQYNLRCPAAKDISITHATIAPSNLHAATTMRLATSGSKPASLDAHGNTKGQLSCSHFISFCKQRFQNTM